MVSSMALGARVRRRSGRMSPTTETALELVFAGETILVLYVMQFDESRIPRLEPQVVLVLHW